jgi:hypothetical protein
MEAIMLTYEDCLGMADLTANEVTAISLHRHIPDMVACEWVSMTLDQPDGYNEVIGSICQAIQHAKHHHNTLQTLVCRKGLTELMRSCHH